MDMEMEFIGRNRELEDFDKFLIGERQNWYGRGMGAPLLLVVGDEGMGKCALLRAMAERALEQNHYVIPREVDASSHDFCEQIYPIIVMLNAMVKKKEPLAFQMLKEINWCKVGVEVLGKIVPGVKPLVDILQEIRKEHKDTSVNNDSLALLFYAALLELDSKIGEDQKIIVFIYPVGESPKALIPLLRGIYLSHEEIPWKVRFVIAQRPKDAIIKIIGESGEYRKLKKLCAKPIRLGRMDKNDSLEFIKHYAPDCELNEATREVFLERYGGWPGLMEMCLDELKEVEGGITVEIIKNLPQEIKHFWKIRDDEVKTPESRAFLETVNLLPHPYLQGAVAGFANLEPDVLDIAALPSSPVWRLLMEDDYEAPYSREIWKSCPTHKNYTEKEYVLENLKTPKKKGTYKKRLDAIVVHYNKLLEDDFDGADENQNALTHDALVYIFSYMLDGLQWDKIKELLTDINYLKRMQSPELQYIFQKYFIDLLNNQEISNKKLVEILKGVLNAVCEQLETGKLETKEQLKIGKQKADWLDTFAYWINEFGPKEDSKRLLALKDVAIKFDNECGKVSKELAQAFLKKEENSWALRFAELHTWVCQRAGDYEKCVDACAKAEEMCKGMEKKDDKAYQLLGRAEFVRMRARALRILSETETDEEKRAKYEADAPKAYNELNDAFSKVVAGDWRPTEEEWKMLEEDNGELPTPPSQRKSAENKAFRAEVVSNAHDCISAMHIIQFFEKHGGLVEWIHHTKFQPEQFAPEDTLFTVLVGGPKAPGISTVADKFYEVDKESFLRMYSGLHFEAHRLKTEEGKGKTQCYMLGGISKVNTLKAAYDFTADAKVMQIINKVKN